VSRLAARFRELKARNEAALICFVTAGDPSEDLTVEVVNEIARAGADAVEIGLPFSDPLADGPSVQASSQRALESGMTTIKALALVRRIREANPDLPLILMTYYNPIRHYGLEKYAQDARAAGADAHIVTDLTPEEAADWKKYSVENGLDTVFLLAPTSTPDRVKVVAELSTGFLYCVSRTGVTGARKDVPAEVVEVVGRIRAQTTVPICVGFGVSTAEHVRAICSFADGAVVGSSLVDLIHHNRENPELLRTVHDYVAELKSGTKSQ
jgi:tryptophan synthase alpha chain